MVLWWCSGTLPYVVLVVVSPKTCNHIGLTF